MLKGIIFTDVDGTLIDSSHVLRGRTIRALAKANDSGWAVAISTGRCADGLAAITEALPFRPCLCTLNGAYILGPAGEVVHSEPMPEADALAAASLIRRRGLGSLYFSGANWGSDDDYEYETEAGIVGHGGLRLPLEEVIRARGVHKIIAAGDGPAFARDAADVLKGCSLVSSSPRFTEINAGGVSKGKAVEVLASHLGVDPSRTISFSDWDNDIPMFRAAGWSVCLSNGSPAAKAAAGETAPSNDDDGLAVWLEERLDSFAFPCRTER